MSWLLLALYVIVPCGMVSVVALTLGLVAWCIDEWRQL